MSTKSFIKIKNNASLTYNKHKSASSVEANPDSKNYIYQFIENEIKLKIAEMRKAAIDQIHSEIRKETVKTLKHIQESMLQNSPFFGKSGQNSSLISNYLAGANSTSSLNSNAQLSFGHHLQNSFNSTIGQLSNNFANVITKALMRFG